MALVGLFAAGFLALSLVDPAAGAIAPDVALPSGLPRSADPNGPLSRIAASASASDCVREIEATESQAAKDRAVVTAVAKAVQTGGMPAMNGRLEDIVAVVDHMPVRELTLCDGKTYTRGMDPADLLGALLGAKRQANMQIVVLGPSPYPLAARLLGSAYLDWGDFGRADAVMKRGLALSPADPSLANEEALTLTKLHRPADGLAVVERAISADVLAPKPVQARLLRTKGYTLGDLGRYDDAIAAYQDSLKLEADNGLAKNEIIYLTHRKAGGTPQRDETVLSGQGKTVAAPN